MADYFSKTVITPPIPLRDMTELEKLLLSAVFEHHDDQDGTRYFFAPECPQSVCLRVADLRKALDATPEEEGSIRADIATLLRETTASEDDMIDLDTDFDGEEMEITLQDIVRRSKTLTEIVITTSFTCSKMRPDGFGGAITLVTADDILSGSTQSLLQEFRAKISDKPSSEATPTVHIAVYEHAHGSDVRVFTTHEAARAWKQEIAEKCWDIEMPSALKKPADTQEMINAYFEHVGETQGEYFSIYNGMIEGEPLAAAPIFAAVYENRDGHQTRLFKDASLAEKWRQEIAAERWASVMSKDAEKPSDPAKLADLYFGSAGMLLEHFSIDKTIVEG
jgi:hypothetical protein